MSIGIIIADTYPCVLRGIRDLLEEQPGMEVIAEATDGEMLLDMVRKHRPGVVITEILLPKMDGIEVTRKIREEFNTIKVIAVSDYCNRLSVERMLRAGAKGFLTKDFAPEELAKAIRMVCIGSAYLCQKAMNLMAKDLVQFLDGRNPPPSEELTPMELKIAIFIGMEFSNKEIAKEFHIGKKTVEVHRENIKKKLGVKGNVGIVKYLIRENLLPNFQEGKIFPKGFFDKI